jgi:hypothetical protein
MLCAGGNDEAHTQTGIRPALLVEDPGPNIPAAVVDSGRGEENNPTRNVFISIENATQNDLP